MADLRNQLAEIYVKVIADTKSAEASMNNAAESLKKGAKGLQDLIDTNAKAQEKLSKLSEEQAKKQSKRILKEFGLTKLLDESRVKRLKELVKKAEGLEKDRLDVLKKNARKIELIEAHIQDKLTRFRDYAGKLDDEQLKKAQGRNLQRQASYESFLRRASAEHSRYAARLDQRDMTANMFENLRRGFQKGILISNKWHRDENTMQRVARGIEIAGTAFHKMRGPAQMAALRFQTMQRVAYALQAVIGSIAGSIGALIGGLMALVGVLGQASYALIAIGSSFASIGAGAIAARLALGGVGQAVSGLLDQQNAYNRSLRDAKRAFRDLRFEVEEAALSEEEAAINLERAREELARVQDLPPDTRARREAELQFQQAELGYRRAKARSKDAREDLKKGPLGGGAVQDPLAKLTASQKVFARYLASLKPQLDTLKEAAASGFLPILQQAISILVARALPTLTIGLNTLGTAMGNAAKSFSEAFTTPQNLQLLREFFESSKPLLETFGRVAGNAIGGVLGILKAAQPLTERFGKWVEKSSEDFEKWGKSTGLESFLNLAGDVAASLGGVIKSVFGGLKNILEATFPGGDVNAGAGGVMLKWLQAIADGFKAFTGNREFGAWLQGATANATTALSAIGALLKPITDIAAMPEIGEFWTVLRGAAEPIKKLLEDGAKAGPEFAALLVSLTKLLAAFSDSGALEAFFKTLTAISNVLVAVFTNPIVKSFLDFIGRIHGVFLAIGLALIVARGLMLVFSGITATVVKTVGGLAAGVTKVSVATMTTVMRFNALKREGLTTAQAVSGVATGFVKSAAKAANTRRSAMLLQIAKDAGMATNRLKTLEMQLNNVINKSNKPLTNKQMLAAAAGETKYVNSKGNLVAIPGAKVIADDPARKSMQATAGGRFGKSRAASALAGGSMMLAGMGGATGPVSGALGFASMAASFIPGIGGLIAGPLLGIGSMVAGAIESGNQKAKERAQQESQRKIEINAKNAEITAQNLTQLKATGQSLVAAGAKATDVKQITDTAATFLKRQGIAGISTIGQAENAFTGIVQSGFADVFAGSNEALKTSVLKSISTVAKSGLYTAEEAAQLLDPIFDEAGGGAKGLKAVQNYVTEKQFGGSQTVTPFGSNKPVVVSTTEAANIKGENEIKRATEKYQEIIKNLTPLSKQDPGDVSIGDVQRAFNLTATEYKQTFRTLNNLTGPEQARAAIEVYKRAIASGDISLMPQATPYGLVRNDRIDFKALQQGQNYGAMMQAVSNRMGTDAAALKAENIANTNANAATTMMNAANVLSNVANAATSQPTYVLYNITSKDGKTNVLDIFAANGVYPVGFSGRYGG
jgi:hypothetical protein